MVEACARGTWTPPPLPDRVRDAVAAASPPRFDLHEFGRPMRDAHFALAPEWTFVNHGAFGAPCGSGVAVAAAWRAHAEEQPLRFIDRELFAHLVESTRVVADWIGASPRELVLLPNATAGLNAVVASVVGSLSPGDEVVYADVGYGSVATMIGRACRRSGAMPVVVPIADSLPDSASEAEVVSRFAAALTPRTRLVVIDDVTSNTAIPMPVAAVCDLARSRGALTLVDAAHSACSRPHAPIPFLDRADFVAGNLHKWACAPRGSAFLRVGEELQARLDPPVISHGYGAGFASSFIWSGAADYSALLALPSVVQGWWGGGGLDSGAGGDGGVGRSVAYQRALLEEAVGLLSAAWGTEPLLPPAACYNMALVRLPDRLRGADGRALATSKAVQDELHFGHAVEVPVKTVRGSMYVRLSCAIYNERADYERVASAILSMR